MKRFYIIDDYSSAGRAIWDWFLLEQMPLLPSKPKGWDRQSPLPEGDWTVANGMWAQSSDESYMEAGIRKPTFGQLPVIFCVTDDGIEEQCRVTATQAREFVAARIG
jgi:hypothetical protein